jgi:hypothetical protein
MLRECTKLRSIRKFTPQRKAAIGMMDRALKYDRRQFICAAGETIAAARLGMIPFPKYLSSSLSNKWALQNSSFGWMKRKKRKCRELTNIESMFVCILITLTIG